MVSIPLHFMKHHSPKFMTWLFYTSIYYDILEEQVWWIACSVCIGVPFMCLAFMYTTKNCKDFYWKLCKEDMVWRWCLHQRCLLDNTICDVINLGFIGKIASIGNRKMRNSVLIPLWITAVWCCNLCWESFNLLYSLTIYW